MRKLQTNKKKLAPLIVCSLLVSSLGSITNNAEASTIVDGGGNTLKPNFQTGAYEIRPDIFNGKVGFKKFQEMNLSQGDIMNFIFQAYNMDEVLDPNNNLDINSWDIDTFVNLVRDQIQLNGIVNAVKSFEGGLKNDGNLVFISPNGMVVGASGVLNVGSLHTYTPSVESFNSLYNRMPTLAPGKKPSGEDYTYSIDAQRTELSLADIEGLKGSEGPISINGRILARGEVGLNGSDVNVGGTGIIIAGVDDTTAFNKQNLGADKDEAAIRVTADDLFTQLVNAGETNSANKFSANNGKIVITSSNGTDIASGAIVRNYADYDGGITITNTGTNGVKINGEVSNITGNLAVDNQAGALNVGSDGLVRNNGTMNITNTDSGTGISIAGTVENDGTMNITNDSGNNGLSISGSVTNDTGAAKIYNKLGGLDVSGSVTSNGTSLAMTNDGDDGFTIASGGSVTSTNGDADLTNNENIFDIDGTVTNSGATLDITNSGANGLNIAGDVLNKNGIGNIQNTQGGLNVQEGGLVQNDGTSIAMTNSGDGGFTIDGSVTNNAGSADLDNTNNMFDINGTVSNSGTTLDITNSGNNGLSIDGTVHNSNGSATMTNEAGEFLVSGSGKVIGDSSSQKITMTNTNTGSGFTMAGSVNNINELEMSNAGSNGFDISGTVTNDGNADISNTAGLLNISGTVTNAGNLDIYNHNTGTGFDISGTVSNSEGIANLTNDAGAFDILEGGEVNSNGTQLNITNNGADGLNIAGDVLNKTGIANIQNTQGGLHVEATGLVQNDGTSLTMHNEGANGFIIDGDVLNNTGEANLLNDKGGLNVTNTGEVINNGAKLTMLNAGDGGFTIDGSVTNNNGTATLENTKNMFDINGTVSSQNTATKLDIKNSGENGLNIAGQVLNKVGSVEITNTQGGLNVLEEGLIQNDGTSLKMSNDGADGTNIAGQVLNTAGTAEINNFNGGLNVDNLVQNDGTSLDMTNSGNGGFIVDGLIDNNSGDATLTNTAGNFDINNEINNSGDALAISNSGTGTLNVPGKVINSGASLDMTNEGSGGFIIDGLVDNDNGNATLTNTAGNFDINNEINNSGGALSVQNSGTGALNVPGKVINTGESLDMTNDGTNGFIIDGLVDNDNGDATLVNTAGNFNINEGGKVDNGTGAGTLTMQNSGNGTLNIQTGGTVLNDGAGLEMSNAGNGGFIVDGLIDNNSGDATLTNSAGNFDINNEVNNSGADLSMSNSGTGEFNVQAGANVINSGTGLEMTNAGDGGFIIDGTVTNTNGDAELTNNNNMFDINGSVINSGNSLAIANSGENGLGISGTVTNQNGPVSITNTNGSLEIDGQVIGEENSQSMSIVNKENGTGLTITGSVNNINKLTISNESGTEGLNIAGTVTNNGDADIKNTAAGGLNIKGNGTVTNSTGYLRMTNTQGGLNIAPDANINSSGSEIVMNNSGNGGMNIQGHVTNTNNAAKVEFHNNNSDMVIGHESTDNNIQSNADILMAIQNGNLLNYFADKGINPTDAGYKDATKTLITTTEGADLTINAQNGQIGTDLGLCDGGVCTGIGPNERNLTKSINTSIDGTITADSTGENALVNMASLDTDMRVNKIHAENGKVILLADDKYDKGANRYDIVNRAEDETVPNLKGDSISAIASGNIGEDADNKLTFIQTNANVDIANENDDASKAHDLYDTPIAESKGGVEFLAQGDINIKGLDNADGTKNDTKVCTIASREGSVNAEFSGDTYIRDITAQNEVNIVNRGPEIYIENLGGAPSRYVETGDYYGMYDGIVPEKANITALDLGTPDDPHTFENGHYPNSTIVIKNGTINGKGSVSHPGMDQDITVTADNAYVGGYYFNMGKHRYDDPNNPNGLSQVTKDPTTNPIVNAGDPDTPVSIRGKAVRPDDVNEIGQDEGLRSYYYWDQDGDGHPENNDPDPDGSGQKDNDDFEEPFDPDVEGGDDLVVPEPEPVEPPPGDDDDDDGPVDPGDDDDDDGPVDPGDDDDDDGPDVPPGDDDDDDGPDEPPADMDDAKRTWKKEIDDNISVIDKRQYIRFDIEGNPNPVIFESVPEVSGILNISRGGVQLSHNKTLKVGDIVPVHLKYGDVEINANVKIVSANDRTAGGEFVDLDLATANQLLYLSLLMDGSGNIQQEQYAQTENGAISTTGEDE